MQREILLSALFCLLVQSAIAGSAPIIRDPQIDIRTRSVIVSWNTDVPGDSVIKVGGITASTETLQTEHMMAIGGLQPDREYELEIMSSNGEATSRYHNTIYTKVLNAQLIETQGQHVVEALTELYGAIDDEALSPSVNHVLHLRQVVILQRLYEEIDEEISRQQSLLDELQLSCNYIVNPSDFDETPVLFNSFYENNRVYLPNVTDQEVISVTDLEVLSISKKHKAQLLQLQNKQAEIQARIDAIE